MSVQVNNYIMYGYHLNYEDARAALLKNLGGDEEKLEELLDNYSHSAYNSNVVKINGCSIVDDPMDGKDFFFGKVYAKSIDGEYLNTRKIKKPKKEVREKIHQEFIRLFGNDFSTVKPGMYLVVNYR